MPMLACKDVFPLTEAAGTMGSEKEVRLFVSACERLLAAAHVQTPLGEDEMTLVEYYCKELLEKFVRRN